jgi:hypothetical protein
MKIKPIWIFLLLILSACSVLPIDIIISDPTPTTVVWTATAIQPIETLCPGCEATATVTPEAPIVTNTPVVETPQETPISTDLPQATATAQIITLVPTETSSPTAIPPTATSVPINVRFNVQEGSPVYIPNFAHPQAACNWMGVAGQVFNKAGSPMPNVVVVAEGYLDGRPLELISLTSLASAYGPGGFELPLAQKTVATTNAVYLSIYNLEGNQLSAPLALQTFTDCEKNLIVVNFKEK